MEEADGNLLEGAVMEDAPFAVTDEVQVGDLSQVKEDESIPAAKGVTFRISKASRRDQREDGKKEAPKDDSNPVVRKKLVLDAVITELGTDGSGKYARKHFFPEVLIWADLTHQYNTGDKFQSETKGYLNDFKRLLEALGYDIKQPPAVNDSFLSELASREFMADLTREEIRAKQEDGTWEGTGNYKNVVRRIRVVGA